MVAKNPNNTEESSPNGLKILLSKQLASDAQEENNPPEPNWWVAVQPLQSQHPF